MQLATTGEATHAAELGRVGGVKMIFSYCRCQFKVHNFSPKQKHVFTFARIDHDS